MNPVRPNSFPKGKQALSPYSLPYYSQFSSPDLVLEIVSGRIRAEDDPRWQEFGADSRANYAFWAWKACGIACLKMAIEALGGPVQRMMDWIKGALALNGFLSIEKAGAGKPSGWIHRRLAELAKNAGLGGYCSAPVGIEDVCRCIDKHQLVIASVTYELGTRKEITRNMGHLVVVHGYSVLRGEIEALLINNPSGRYPELRQNCWIPASRFALGFSGRIISISKPDRD